MHRCRVLVINDSTEKGGPDEGYSQSAELLRAMRDGDVECFDQGTISANEATGAPSWNFAAASALAKVMTDFGAHRVLVHNFRNFMSTSVLGVIAQYWREPGYTPFLTCHDYHLVNTGMQQSPCFAIMGDVKRALYFWVRGSMTRGTTRPFVAAARQERLAGIVCRTRLTGRLLLKYVHRTKQAISLAPVINGTTQAIHRPNARCIDASIGYETR